MDTESEPPFELRARSLVNLGPEYATIISLGKRGASDVIHVTPLGHATLTARLREPQNAARRDRRARAKGTP